MARPFPSNLPLMTLTILVQHDSRKKKSKNDKKISRQILCDNTKFRAFNVKNSGIFAKKKLSLKLDSLGILLDKWGLMCSWLILVVLFHGGLGKI